MALSSWIRNWKRSIERRWAIYHTIRRKNVARRLANRPRLEALEDRWLLSTYLVTGTGNSGGGSFADAINQANGGTITEIDFHIGTQGQSSGVQTISPAMNTPLPTLTAKGVFVNGYSENVWQGVSSTSPLIEINGSGAGLVQGFEVSGTNDIVSGLFITNFFDGIIVNSANNTIGGTTAGAGNVISGSAAYGVWLQGGGTSNVIEGNFIGTDETGTSSVANQYGFRVQGGGNTIGGTASGAGNVISGNSVYGVDLEAGGTLLQDNYVGTNAAGTGGLGNSIGIEVTSSGNTLEGNVVSGNSQYGVDIEASNATVQGNYIGTDHTGTASIANSDGLFVNSSGNTVGGTASGAGNVISGNSTNGIFINAGGVQLLGNYIGTDHTGTKALANPIGVNVASSGVTVGGTTSSAGNVISGNSTFGIAINTSGTLVQDNYIGTAVGGATAVANSIGVNIAGSNNTVGTGNVISGNTGDGVLVSSGAGNTITQNSIFANPGPGISLASGANNNIAAPTISSASITGYTLTVKGTFTAATANVAYVLEFFGSANGDAEGKAYIGSLKVTPTSTGSQNFTYSATTTVPRIYPLVTATVTDNAGNTSTFSNGVDATTIYTVTSTADTGAGSLRDAITQANNTASGITTIDFAIKTSGSAQTISPASALPTLTANNVFINGLSQGGLSNTTALITLDGTSAGSGSDGLLLQGSTDVVSGVIIQKFKNGIEDAGANNTIGGSATTVVLPANVLPLTIGQGNVLSGNTNDGLLIDSGATGVQVQGNFIGTNTAGTAALANAVGVEVAGANNTIGGTASGAVNVISGNSAEGMLIDSTASGVSVQGNYIGTDVTGTTAVANGSFGIAVGGPTNTIGGTATGAGNVISGNFGDGLFMSGSASGMAVQGNYIGTDRTGANPLGNNGNGVNIDVSNNTVGAGNIISANGKNGVLVSFGSGDTITQNSIYGNTGLGISLASNGNNNIAAPTITSASVTGYTLTVKGTFTAATANVSYVLEFFGSANGDAEGKAYIGALTVKPTSTGTQNFTYSPTTLLPRFYPLITATLTDNLGDTSQFSNGVSTGTVYTVTSTADSGTGSLRDAITQANNPANGITTINFAIGTSGSAQTITPASALPTLTASNVFINGLSQGGLSNSTPLITVDGTSAGSGTDGLLLQGTSGVVSGLTFEHFSKNGVEVAAANNTIGGSVAGQGNVLSGNTNDGLMIDSGVSGVQVQGNFIGTDATGTKAVANGVGGVEVAGTNNTIGGTTSGARNLVSGNTTDGLLIDSGATGNQVMGNYIGTNVNGTSPAPILNYPNGFASAGSTFTYNGGSSLVGSALQLTDGGGNEARSIFTTNKISISAFTTTWTQNISGGNGTADGMTFCIQTDGNNVVGGAGGSLGYQGLGKSIAIKFDLYNNSGEGVNSTGLFTDGVNPTVPAIDLTPSGINLHSGDNMKVTLTYDGTNLTETIFDATANKTFTHTYTINIASTVGSSTAYVGWTAGTGGAAFTGQILNATYTTPLPVGNGVGVSVNGANNTIGGTATGAGNVISGNTSAGLQISASGVMVQGDYIGTDSTGTAAAPNSIGINIAGNNNTVGAGNIISGNTSDGVLVSSGSGNTITQNSIFANTGPGISLASGANNNIAAPTISIAPFGSVLTVKGTFTAATANVPYVLQFFASATGDAEGKVYLGSVTVTPTSTGSQNFSFSTTTTVPATYPLITATLTDNLGDTSAFSAGVAVTPVTQFVVTSTADTTSAGTLRNAITQINSAPAGYFEIDFAIGTSGSAQTIALTSALPALTANNVFINGLSQGGSSNTKQLITLSGSGAGSSSDGLLLQGTGDLVSGLIIETFGKNGLEVDGANNTIGGTTTGAGNILSGNTNDGLLIDSVSGNQVLGNYIGVIANNTALGNSGNGIEIAGTGNTVGAAVSGGRNIISVSSKDGVLIDSGASGNQVLGNYIGLDIGGTKILGKTANGVEVASSSNTIGGTVSGATNVLSGNTNDGLLLDSTASANLVVFNDIGTDKTGNVSLGNSGNGIEVQGNGNTLGGASGFVRNIIGGSGIDGVRIDSGASGILVQGNYIGVAASGTAPVANGEGVYIAGNNNTIGGTSNGARNLISGNSTGVQIFSGSGVQVLGNYIGTDVTGTKALADSVGVEVESSGGVTIGGTASGARNIISGNSGDGVLLNPASSGVQVQGNYIGTDVTGAKALANSVGVEVQTSSNTIGGTVMGARNIISGNTHDGVLIDDGASGVQVQGNYIGTDVTGTKALANSVGVEVNASANTIGGSVAGASNLLSGNSIYGVVIDAGISGVQVQGNLIGTDTTGTKIVANNFGVYVLGSNNTVGGTTTAARNVISGSNDDGVFIGKSVSGVAVQGNYIGLSVGGTAALANSVGIEDAGSGNVLGGSVSGAGNYISGNSGDGVLLDSTAKGEALLGNFIGLTGKGTAALANGSNGIEIAGVNNTIGGTAQFDRTYISGNGKDGVLIDSAATGNVMLNAFIGLDTSGTNGVGNAANGVEVAGSSNTIGGTISGATNIESANKNDGVLLDSTASSNLVADNWVGTDKSGKVGVANSGNGIEVMGNGNTLGGVAGYARNIVADNSGDGVHIDSGVSGTLVQGNYIGVNYSSAALANGGNGVSIAGNSNTIGGTASGGRNIISGNTTNGVLLASGGSGNVVQGDDIGTDATGSKGVGNIGNGVEILGNGNMVGGTSSAALNIIAGNTGDGVRINSGASGNSVLGNFIGVNASAAALANSGSGVDLFGTKDTIGGTVTGSRNIIAGNAGGGMVFQSTATANLAQSNYVGLNGPGSAVGNTGDGVLFLGTNNTVGGTITAARNVISANSNDGVQFDSGASGNVLLGNYIGLNISGTAALGNSIGVEDASSGNTIGGSSGIDRNYISGNSKDGILLDSGAKGETIQSNYIGLNGAGTAAVGNSIGIEDASSGNTIGASVSGAGNYISGNSKDGVLLDSGAKGEVVEGNVIGLTGPGTAALANGGNGIEVQGLNNTIGGTTQFDRNYVSGNTKDGVLIDSAASGNVVLGNFIGLDTSGTHGVGNVTNGVEVAGSSNTIGGTVSGATNIESANTKDGILLDSTASSDLVADNWVGTDKTGKVGVGNSGNGVEIMGAGNKLGGTAGYSRNIISGNSGDGVVLDTGASGTLVQGNYIGVNYSAAALGNSGNGVNVSSNNNTIGGTVGGASNVISSNGKIGVLISAGSGTTVSRNSIYANTGQGISLASGANNNLAAPSLFSATLNGSTLTVKGSFTAPTANVSYVLEFFANLSGDPEGRVYLGSMTVKPTTTGTVSFTYNTTNTSQLGTYPLITATLTDNLGDTSAFSNGATS